MNSRANHSPLFPASGGLLALKCLGCSISSIECVVALICSIHGIILQVLTNLESLTSSDVYISDPQKGPHTHICAHNLLHLTCRSVVKTESLSNPATHTKNRAAYWHNLARIYWPILNTKGANTPPPSSCPGAASGRSNAHPSAPTIGKACQVKDAWQGSSLWSTTDSCLKCFSELASLALMVNAMCVCVHVWPVRVVAWRQLNLMENLKNYVLHFWLELLRKGSVW